LANVFVLQGVMIYFPDSGRAMQTPTGVHADRISNRPGAVQAWLVSIHSLKRY
jgi:hypothetical protein